MHESAECASSRWAWRIAAAVLILLGMVVVWVSFGHHRYVLYGDPGGNFIQNAALGNDYFPANLKALARRRAGEPASTAGHVALLVEGGFPVLLLAARQFGERVPFMVNAVLVPLLLFGLSFCLAYTDTRRKRGVIGAVCMLCMLLSFPSSSALTWNLVLPFRDTLSHVSGFMALALVLWVCAASRGRWSWVLILAAGFMVGWSGFSRLSGILFIVPVGAVVAFYPEHASPLKRLRWLVILGVGASAGVGLVIVQNLLEGRLLFQVPQSEALLLRTKYAHHGLPVRKGWHPANMQFILPRLLQTVWDIFPSWLSPLLLAGFAGWMVTAARKSFRVLPIAGAFAAFTLFYACYDKVVGRYSLIIVFFLAMALAMGAAWIIDLLIRGVSRLFRADGQALAALPVVLLSLMTMHSALHSGQDWLRAASEWRDARAFKKWARNTLPADAAVLTTDARLGTWLRYFLPEVKRWSMPFGKTDMLDIDKVAAPDDARAFMLVSYSGEPSAYSSGWTLDALLNRYDVEESGEPLSFQSKNNWARFLRVSRRGALTQTVRIATRSEQTPFLYLYLRDWPSAPGGGMVSLSAAGWPRTWSVRLNAGVNILTVPDGIATRPETIRISAEMPLPSVLEAAWTGMVPVKARMSEYDFIASRLLQVSGVELSWSGFPNWNRDWGAFSPRHRSRPRVMLNDDARIRVPNVCIPPDHVLVMRVYYSALAHQCKSFGRFSHAIYRCGEDPLRPLTGLLNPYYSSRHFEWISDFLHEIEIPSACSDMPGKWLAPEFPPVVSAGEDGDAYLFLHQIEYEIVPASSAPLRGNVFLEGDADAISWEWRAPPHSQWMVNGFEDVAWPGRRLRPLMSRIASHLPDDGILLADGVIRDFWRSYGAYPTDSALQLLGNGSDGVWRLTEKVNAWLQDGRAVHVLESYMTAGGDAGAYHTVSMFYDARRIFPLAEEDGARLLDAQVSPDAALYRLAAWSRREVETTVQRGSLAEGILKVDSKWLWRPDLARRYAHLTLNGDLLDDAVTNGVCYYHLDAPPDEIAVALHSDAPVPGILNAEFLPPLASVRLAVPPSAAMAIPRIWPSASYGVLAELRGIPADDGDCSAWVLEYAGKPVETACLRDGGDTVRVFMLPGDGDSRCMVAWRHRSGSDLADMPDAGVVTLRLTPIPVGAPRSAVIGSENDFPNIGPGFHGPELFHGQTAFRWTSAESLVHLYEPGGGADGVIRIVFHDSRPPGASPSSMRVFVNGLRMEGRDAGLSSQAPFRVWQGTIPANGWRLGRNTVSIQTDAWSPASMGGGSDERLLGVMLHRVDAIVK